MIGIIGCGVVGGAIKKGFEKKGLNVSVYDPFKYPLRSITEIKDCPIVFVCVPTPTDESGEQDINALEETFARLHLIEYKGIVAIKSTVLPGSIVRLAQIYEDLRIITNPEFLRTRSASEDFLNQQYAIIGNTSVNDGGELADLYVKHWPGIHILRMNLAESMMVKYAVNCILATRVALMNEICEAHKAAGIEFEWQQVLTGLLLHPRLGGSHMSIPGPDGKRGFGGECFPKDMRSMAGFIREQLSCGSVLANALESNSIIRSTSDLSLAMKAAPPSMVDIDECIDFLIARNPTCFSGNERDEHKEWLSDVRALHPRIILEIGACWGRTTWLLSRVCPKDALIITIDQYAPWFGFEQMALPDQRIVAITGDSCNKVTCQEVEQVLGNEKIDLLFIDSSHEYDATQTEVALYLPLVRKGSSIAFHDILLHHSGVRAVWKEIVGKYPIHKQYDKGQYGIGMATIS